MHKTQVFRIDKALILNQLINFPIKCMEIIELLLNYQYEVYRIKT